MDIMRGRIEEQVSPPPHLARLAAVDTKALIRRTILRHPEKTPDEITALINSWGIPVSGIWVARIKQLLDQKSQETRNQALAA